MTTVYGFTDMHNNVPENNREQINPIPAYGIYTQTGTSLSRTLAGTVGGNQYYTYTPTYALNTSESAVSRQLVYDNYFVRVYIHEDIFASGEQPPGLNDIIYLDLPANSKKVALKRVTINGASTITSQSLVGSGSGNYYVFEFVSSSNDPICLTDTCDILTPNGYVNVKDLSIGDLVTTPEGKNVKITKVMKPTTYVAMGKALPHFIPKNSLGENKPTKDTFISKNHAYKSGDEWLCGQFNIEHNATNWDQDFVTYYNIMTEDYPKHTLVVNGVEMESWGGYEHNKPETHGNIKLRREKLGFK